MEAAEELIEADKKLREKVLEHFTGSVVRKDLAFQVKGNLPVPTYVLEYLLAQYCTSPDEAEIAKGLEKVKEVISQHYFNRAHPRPGIVCDHRQGVGLAGSVGRRVLLFVREP